MSGSHPAWIYKGGTLLFVVFCIELGLFLTVYPWTTRWNMSFIPAWIPISPEVWLSGYFRGAISGVGVANLWVALNELVHLRSGRSTREKVTTQP